MRLLAFRVGTDSIALLIDHGVKIILKNKELYFENKYEASDYLRKKLDGDLHVLCPSFFNSDPRYTLDSGHKIGRYE